METFGKVLITARDGFSYGSDYIDADSDQVAIASKFTIGATGPNQIFVGQKLEILMIRGENVIADEIFVEIRSWDNDTNKPGSYVYATKTISKDDIPSTDFTGSWYDDAEWIDCGEMGNITFQKNTSYAIVIHMGPGVVDDNTKAYMIFYKDETEIPTQKLINSVDGGITWGSDRLDVERTMGFILYGTYWGNEAVEYADLVNLAGKGVNSDAKSIETARSFIENTQGDIEAQTRYPWSSEWNNLNEPGRRIVRTAVMSETAILMINYDMSGYDSRFEAEYLTSVLKERAINAVEALRDQKVQAYLKNG
jgi:hypothetical protein